MDHAQDFLYNLALVLGVAALTTIVSQRLRLPVVFGYMLAGLIIGPHVPVPLVADVGMVRTLAELGVILLMFSLGLEFSLRRIVQVGATAAIIAALETSIMVWLGFTAARLLGWSPLESVYAGAMIAISSTTIIVKALGERSGDERARRVVFGVLVYEDLIAIALIAILTGASSGMGLSPGGIAVTFGRLAAFLAGLLVVGLLVVPRLVRLVVRLDRKETTLVTCIGLCFGTALLARSFGTSVALGAFIAGSLVAESGESRQVENLVEPVRDMFVAVFFVAVGMLIDPALVASHAGPIVLFTVLVVAGKVAAVSLSAFLTGHGIPDSVRTGLTLAQIGEFSFIIVGVGAATGATRDLFPVAVAVSAVTTLLTPWLIGAAGPAAAALDRNLPRALQTFAALYGSWIEKLRSTRPLAADEARMRRAIRVLLVDAAVLAAIAVGVSVELPDLGRWLERSLGVTPLAAASIVLAAASAVSAPFAIGMVRTTRGLGQALATRVFPAPVSGRLDLAAAPRRALVVTLQLAIVLLVGAPLLAATQPFLPAPVVVVALVAVLLVLTVAFWRSATNFQGHARAGAEAIVAALASQGREPQAAQGDLERVYELLPGLGSPTPVVLAQGSPGIGRSLAELNIRGRTGATVLGIRRGDEVVLVPDGHRLLMAGDILALAGTQESVESARDLLTAGPSVP